ncbi:MAG TPA: SCP2 sterol-binding domain-containing protein [Methylophilus sp.]
MFKPLITRFLQHLTNQNNWARPHLLSFAGKVIQFNFSVANTSVLILEDGSLSAAGDTAVADATVHIPPSLAMRLLAKDETAKSYIKIDGDTHLAAEVSKVLQLMRWDIEEDLSRVVGDIGAYKIGEITQKTLAEIKQQGANAVDMVSEYWQEEKNILAKKRHVEQFNQDVDTLRNDVERLKKRLEKTHATLSQTDTTQQVKPNAKPAQESTEK